MFLLISPTADVPFVPSSKESSGGLCALCIARWRQHCLLISFLSLLPPLPFTTITLCLYCIGNHFMGSALLTLVIDSKSIKDRIFSVIEEV